MSSFYSNFKKLSTTSDIEEEKKKRVKDLSKQKEDKSTTAKDLTKIMKGNVIGDEEYQYFMKLIGGETKQIMAKRKGLYANIAAKRKRIKAGSGERMRKVGSKGSPTTANFKRAAKTAKKVKKSKKK